MLEKRVRHGNYEPNNFDGPEVEPPLEISDDADWYERKRGVDGGYAQLGNLFLLVTQAQQQGLIANIVGSLARVQGIGEHPEENGCPFQQV